MSRGFSHESTSIESVEWYTPPEIFEAMNLTFDLDPCSPGEGKSFVPTRQYYSKVERGEDGLSLPWNGMTFVNPPYGSETGKWIQKCSEHKNGVALVFARTDVKWFQKYGSTADLVCFIDGRVKFFKGGVTESDRGGTPGAGSMLLCWGSEAAWAVLRSGLGVCYGRVPETTEGQ